MPYKTPVQLRKSAFDTQRGHCCYCGRSMWLENPKAFAKAHNYSSAQAKLLRCTAEHLHARADGGGDSPENLAAACWYCNIKRHQRKKPMPPDQYRRYVQKRLEKGGWHRLC
ncbi:MAG: HNH endonuclease [Dechloromonas sp.]|nr:HNH endonuclease [Dechloromonas sp.]